MNKAKLQELVKEAQHRVFVAGSRVSREDKETILRPLEIAYQQLQEALQELED